MTRLALAALALAALAPRPAAAQILNVQPLVAEEAEEGLSGTGEASIDWRTGSTDLLLVAGKVLGRWRRGDDLVLLVGSVELGRSADAEILDRSLVHLRYRRTLARRVAGEAFVQHDRDDFRRLSLRALAGAGPRVELVDRARVDVAVAAAYMLEVERYSEGMFADSGDHARAHRLSTYAVVAVALAERLKLGETIYVQPALTDPADVKLLSESELLVTVSARLGFKTTFRLAYDSRPPETVSRHETALKSAIQVTF